MSSEEDITEQQSSVSRLNLAYRRTLNLKRKFPKVEPEILSGSENARSLHSPSSTSITISAPEQSKSVIFPTPALSEDQKGMIGPDGYQWPPLVQGPGGIPHFRSSPIFTEHVDKDGRTWVNLPQKKPKCEPAVKISVDDCGVELFERGWGWNARSETGNFSKHDCEALKRSKEALNGTFVSRYAVLDPNKTYNTPDFPDSTSDSEADIQNAQSQSSPSSTSDFQ